MVIFQLNLINYYFYFLLQRLNILSHLIFNRLSVSNRSVDKYKILRKHFIFMIDRFLEIVAFSVLVESE